MLSPAEENRRDREVELVDEALLEVLADRRDAPAQPDGLSSRRRAGLIESVVDAPGDESELRAALHGEWSARVVGEDEHGRVVRRLLAPPAFPAVVRPR